MSLACSVAEIGVPNIFIDRKTILSHTGEGTLIVMLTHTFARKKKRTVLCSYAKRNHTHFVFYSKK